MSTRHGGQPEGRLRAPASGVRAVFLVGFMGAGKTSVGRVLGRRLGWRFEDLDERIQARERQTIEQIFQQSGEAEFRRAERAALRELLAEPSAPRVVALGGGTLVDRNHGALLEAAGGQAIFLDAPVEELFRRCREERLARPLGRDLDQFRQLYQARRPSYMAAALRIETAGKDIETVAAEVACCLGLRFEE